MKHRIGLLLAAFAVLVLGVAQAQALPVVGFKRNIERALRNEAKGDMEDAQGYWRRVAELGEELLEANSENTTYLMGTARAYYGVGDFARAAQLYEQFLAIHNDLGTSNMGDNYPWVFVYIGLTYGRLGDLQKVFENWERVPMTIGAVYTAIRTELANLRGQQAGEAS